MRWYLATIKSGLDGQPSWGVGRHVRFALTNTGRVLVIGSGDLTAVLTKPEACRRLATVRRGDGSPQPVRDESIRWDRLRESRRFDGVRRKVTA